DGPQQDDIRAAQHFYGDPFEPNETFGTAKALGLLASGAPISLGTIPAPVSGVSDPHAALCSIHGDGDVDYYSFTVNGALSLTATVTPVGSSYDDSPQAGDGSCPASHTTNGLIQADLVLTVYGTNGTTALATANNSIA